MGSELTAWARRALALSAAFIALAVSGSPALAADTHVFDPVLSLTGGCTTSGIDLVADPGCPDKHPPSPFASPRAVAVDFYGDIYVSSIGKNPQTIPKEGRIDVFDSDGVFVTQIPEVEVPISLAVDSKGNVYAFLAEGENEEIVRYSPTEYDPELGKIAYDPTPEVVAEHVFGPMALAINPVNDRLFAHFGNRIVEYGSAAEENKLLDGTIGQSVLFNSNGNGLAIDAAHNRIYASDEGDSPSEFVVRAFELSPPHALVQTFDGSTAPEGKFLSNRLSVAVDEATGNFFVWDGPANVVHEFTASGEYVSSITHDLQYVAFGKMAVDNGPKSPNGALHPDGRYLYVPSHPSGLGHSFAFGPAPKECPPVVEASSFAEVSEGDAELRAQINPCGVDTDYTFEYLTEQAYEEAGKSFTGAAVAGGGQIPTGSQGVTVWASATGLSAGTAYRFRVVAENAKGSDEGEGAFSTYPASAIPPCPNDPLRTGPSALLPDCRAYELVTPADTNGREPLGVGHLGTYFAAPHASPAGDKVSFQIEGGLIPGSDGTGSYAGDPYLATRGQDGWSTAIAGPSGAESTSVLPSSTSPDQGYSFWSTGGSGSAVIGGRSTNYVRYPDGHSELVGRGSIDTDPRAEGKLIAENGAHIVFVSRDFGTVQTAVQLEENAPPDGTDAIYDRTPDEVTHVVSLLPGDITPAAGQDASYVGASLDGEGIAFSIANKLYLRYDNQETYEIGENVTFAGVAEGGGRIFYVKGGNLFAFDVATEAAIPFSSSADVTVVNVSADGTAAYFVSPSVLTAGEENPAGDVAQAGEENLYLSREGAISFVGTVTERDVEGESDGGQPVEGLGLWTIAVGPSPFGGPGRFATDPSRTTPDGSVLLFESRANLTGYDPDGHAQVYRFDSVGGALQCLSCNPTGAPATGETSLQSISHSQGTAEPFSAYALVRNLRADGRRAFFQSTEALVAHDTDGLQDVYEWEDQGVGSCAQPGGCVYLISSGHSLRTDYLFAVSDSGDDVFFRTSDLLLPSDRDETPSIYDARVGGGFPEAAVKVCEGEGCRPQMPPAPGLLAPQTLPNGSGNPPRAKPCPKGKRKVKRNGKVRCVKKHQKKKHHKPGSKKKGAGR
jgi:hypothetical protein